MPTATFNHEPEKHFVKIGGLHGKSLMDPLSSLVMVERLTLSSPAFLVAVPQLVDPNFHRAVVLLVEHGEQGSMGIVVNRPIELDMGEFCASQSLDFFGDSSNKVFQGGPVQTDRAFLLHQSDHEGPETEPVMGQVKLSYSLESLEQIVRTPPPRFRVFLGYAGWGEGQLAEEVTSGAWLVCHADPGVLYTRDPDKMWERVIRSMGIEPVQLMHSGVVH